MYAESEHGEPQFDPDWKAVFERDFCKVCKNRKICPSYWECHDMIEFIENNEGFYEDMDNDDTNNGDL